MNELWILCAAMVLDGVLGEPAFLWNRLSHPAVMMGRVIAWGERCLNHGPHRRLKGVFMMGSLALGAWFLGYAIRLLPMGWVLDLLLTAMLLAQKSLCDHVKAVAGGLRLSVGLGRRRVAKIVGRDVQALDAAGVARAAIESGAENFSDGVIAPIFWYICGGLPALLVYKITNTADSMIGYRTPRYAQFGWAAARFDDVLNYIPARLSALLLMMPQKLFCRDALRVVLRDAPKHRSPNAGWPEAAMAVVLGIALSGPRSYHGETRFYPWVHAGGRRGAGAAEIDHACRILWRAWGIMFVLIGCAGVV